MPTASGPNTLGESNLVFAYDTGDVSNSYKGQPTTNVEASNINATFETISDGDAAGFNNQLGTGNYLGVSSTMGYKSSKSLKINRGTGGTGRIFKTYSVSTGQYSSVSCWVYSTTAGPYLALEYFGGDYSWGVSYTNNTHTGKGWELLYVRTTGPATSNTTAYYFLYPSIQNQDIYLDNIQTELKQYPTTFVNGTRSVTQGLLDLTGYRTIDLTNASFNSNAQMTFDGTNDYIESPATTLSGDFTISQVVNLQSSAAGPMPIGGGLSSNGSTYQAYVWFRNVANQIIVAFNGEIQLIFAVDPALWVNKTIMYNVTKSGSIVTLYINGVVISSNSISPTDQFTIRTIGYSWSSSYHCLGNIDNTLIYNRALSAAEVKQNYQQYKTRFNLS